MRRWMQQPRDCPNYSDGVDGFANMQFGLELYVYEPMSSYVMRCWARLQQSHWPTLSWKVSRYQTCIRRVLALRERRVACSVGSTKPSNSTALLTALGGGSAEVAKSPNQSGSGRKTSFQRLQRILETVRRQWRSSRHFSCPLRSEFERLHLSLIESTSLKQDVTIFGPLQHLSSLLHRPSA
jgi:hypothetical protein